MDPQGRLLLEQSGLALASSEPDKSFSSTEQAVGVYIGVMHMEYIQFMSGKQGTTAFQKNIWQLTLRHCSQVID